MAGNYRLNAVLRQTSITNGENRIIEQRFRLTESVLCLGNSNFNRSLSRR